MSFKRQDEAHDHRVRSNSVDAHYDLLRSAGYSREKARDWANRATDTYYASQEGDAKPVTPSSRTESVGRSRFKVPYFGPHAGRLCRIEDDGTLVPVDRCGECGEPDTIPGTCQASGQKCACCSGCRYDCMMSVR